MTQLCLDRKAAVAALGVSIWTLDQWIADGKLPAVRLPSARHPGEMSRRVLISADDLRAFVERHRTGTVTR
jgi:predicted site-specific integrase-resolvase